MRAMIYFVRNMLMVLPVFFFSCKPKPSEMRTQVDTVRYPTRNYLAVGKSLDSLNTVLRKERDSIGTYTIPYTDLSNGKKRLVFIGTTHTRDLNNPQFDLIAKMFLKEQPEVAFNEGGQVPQRRNYVSIDSAITKAGEIGCLKFLCDELKIQMINGDLEETEEFTKLLEMLPRDQVYLYLAAERFLYPYKHGASKELKFEDAFQKDFVTYLDQHGFALTGEERTAKYLSDLYAHYLHKPLQLDSLVEVPEYYLYDDGIFGTVGRVSKEIRDQALLRKIDQALDRYNRVFVVFGGSHRIAVEPALRLIIAKKRG